LDRVPNSGDWSKFPKESLSTKDIAFLSANLLASKDDRDFLKTIGQNSSIVVSAYDGHEIEFSISLFDF